MGQPTTGNQNGPTSSETADRATAVLAPGDNSKQSSEAKEEGLSEESKSQSVDKTTTTAITGTGEGDPEVEVTGLIPGEIGDGMTDDFFNTDLPL